MMAAEVHFAAYKYKINDTASGTPLKVSNGNLDNLEALKEKRLLEYERDDNDNADNYDVYFNNYTGVFKYKDDKGADKEILVIHKKVCGPAGLFKGCEDCIITPKPCGDNNPAFECNTLVSNYAEFFESFSLEIINGLIAYLPFSIISPTSAEVNESGFSDSLIFKLLLILQKKDEIKGAISHVLANPHRKLVERETLRRFDEVSYVDSDVIIDILHNPHRWIEHNGGCINSRYSPSAVLQYETEESFDTLENRFVKHFLKNLAEAIDECAAYLQKKPNNAKYETIEQNLEALKGEIEQTLSGWIFSEVGSLSVFPSNSQVLMKQSGYRELFRLSQMLRLSFVPAFFKGLDTAFALKSMDVLWEYFVMLDIVYAIKACGYTIKESEWKEKAEEETEYDYAAFDFKKDTKEMKVTYQGSVQVGSGGNYSLRPDFLLKKDTARLVLDAKFMVKENAPTGELSKYLTSKLAGDNKKLSHAVFAACLGENGDLRGEALSFTNMFDNQKCKSFDDMKAVIEMLLNEKISNTNQYIGYIEIKLPAKTGGQQ